MNEAMIQRFARALGGGSAASSHRSPAKPPSERARKARSASASIRGSGPGSSVESARRGDSLRDEIRAAYEEVRGR